MFNFVAPLVNFFLKKSDVFIVNEYDALQREFQDRALEDLTDMENLFIHIEQGNEIVKNFHAANMILHSLKGASGSFGFRLGTTICHNLEDYLESIDSNNFTHVECDKCLVFVALLRRYFENSPNLPEYMKNEILHSLRALSISQSNSSGLRILLAEKSPTVQTLVHKVLAELGVEVAIVSNGYEALGRLLLEEFDGLISATNIDVLDGVQLIHMLDSIGTQFDNFPAALISSFHNPEIHTKGIQIIKKDNNLSDNLAKAISKMKGSSTLFSKQEQSNNELRTVLCIDDNPMMENFYKIAFPAQDNFNVITRSSPSQAISEVSEVCPDLILIDIVLDEMTNEATLKELQNLPNFSAPCILLTGKKSEEEEKRLKESGVSGVVQKPFNPKQLATALHSLLKRPDS